MRYSTHGWRTARRPITATTPLTSAVLATELLSILAGTTATPRSRRFARMASTPELLSVVRLVLKDAARRARMDESSGGAWLDRHLATTTRPVLSTPWNLDLDATLKCP